MRLEWQTKWVVVATFLGTCLWMAASCGEVTVSASGEDTVTVRDTRVAETADAAADVPVARPDATDVGVLPDGCACSDGPCCDDCAFRGRDYVCGTAEERGCPWGEGCGATPGLRSAPQHCSGDSAACEGELGTWGEWEEAADCAATESCAAETGLCAADPTCLCVGGCDDDNPCTADTCDDALGCVYEPANDLEPCVTDDGSLAACRGGYCVAGCLLDEDCDDEAACTTDACDPDSGLCRYFRDHASCDDGNLCTEDLCVVGQGCASEPVADGVGCTTPSGQGGLCDGGVCAPACSSDADCDDALDCTTDSCNQDNGRCRFQAHDEDCDDDNLCTEDACSVATGCVHDPNEEPCADAMCDADGFHPEAICDDGECPVAPALTCDDANACTDDTCDPAAGCQFVNNSAPCADATCEGRRYVPAALCVDGVCDSPASEDCSDGNVCTDDRCDPAAGCVSTDNTEICSPAECRDGRWFSAASCDGGSCAQPTEEDCDDGDPCTDDACDPSRGCTSTPNAAVCAEARCEGGAWFPPSQCVDGACPAAVSEPCADTNGCTDDVCDPERGCLHEPNAAPCRVLAWSEEEVA